MKHLPALFCSVVYGVLQVIITVSCCLALNSPADMAIIVIDLLTWPTPHIMNEWDNVEYLKSRTLIDINWLCILPELIMLPEVQAYRRCSRIIFTTLYITMTMRIWQLAAGIADTEMNGPSNRWFLI